MKIIVIGGSGLIGKKVVKNLHQHGHEVVAASPSLGVNTITGEGLAQALVGAQVVVDVANAPSWEDQAVLAFFETSGSQPPSRRSRRGRRPSCGVVGRRHRPPARERLLPREDGSGNSDQGFPDSLHDRPRHAVLRVVGGMAQSATEGQPVRLPPVLMRPIVSDDVAAVMAETALAEPLNGTVDLAGPEPIRQDDLVRQFLNATGDARTVITDPEALYFGIAVNDQSLTPGDNPRLGPTRFADWLSRNA